MASRTNILSGFTSVIMSVRQYRTSTWYKCLSTTLKPKLFHQINICSKVEGQPLEKFYESANHSNILRLALIIAPTIT